MFSLLARVGFIGPVDKITGKAELRLYVNGIEKPVCRFCVFFPIKLN